MSGIANSLAHSTKQIISIRNFRFVLCAQTPSLKKSIDFFKGGCLAERECEFARFFRRKNRANEHSKRSEAQFVRILQLFFIFSWEIFHFFIKIYLLENIFKFFWKKSIPYGKNRKIQIFFLINFSFWSKIFKFFWENLNFQAKFIIFFVFFIEIYNFFIFWAKKS